MEEDHLFGRFLIAAHTTVMAHRARLGFFVPVEITCPLPSGGNLLLSQALTVHRFAYLLLVFHSVQHAINSGP